MTTKQATANHLSKLIVELRGEPQTNEVRSALDKLKSQFSQLKNLPVTKSAETPELASTHRPLGTHGLWGDRDAQLPAYIQNIAHAMIKDGHDESSAIALAIGAVKRWAAGEGKVTPEVQAAATAALAEWEKLKAEHNKTKAVDTDFIKVGPHGYVHGWVKVGTTEPTIPHDTAVEVSRALNGQGSMPRSKMATSVKLGVKEWTRGGTSQKSLFPQDLANFHAVVSHASANAPKLYRGVHAFEGNKNWPASDPAKLEKVRHLAASKPGDIITNNRPSSWSEDEKVAHDFSAVDRQISSVSPNNVAVQLELDSGARAVNIQKHARSDMKYQKEWVSPPSSYQVTAVEPHPTITGLTVLHVREVNE